MEKKTNCSYPSCKKIGDHRHIIKLINEENSSVNLPFCEYHFYIVIGGHFEAKEVIKDNFEILGPLKEIEIAEQVMGARELIKLKNDNKDL